VKLVFACVNVRVFRQGDFDQCLVLLFAEHDSDGGILAVRLHKAVEIVHVHLHLPEILMGDFADFQIDQDVAAQQAIVEDKIDEEVLFVEGEALLARFEEEAFAEFEEEMFDPVDDCGFQVGFGVASALVEAEEFEDQWLLEQVDRPGDGLSFLGVAANAVFVATGGKALVEAGIELAAEFANGPVLGGGFDFVEAALVGVVDAEEEDVMRPAQREGAGGFSR
jgi:hypothetical protein